MLRVPNFMILIRWKYYYNDLLPRCLPYGFIISVVSYGRTQFCYSFSRSQKYNYAIHLAKARSTWSVTVTALFPTTHFHNMRESIYWINSFPWNLWGCCVYCHPDFHSQHPAGEDFKFSLLLYALAVLIT